MYEVTEAARKVIAGDIWPSEAGEAVYPLAHCMDMIAEAAIREVTRAVQDTAYMRQHAQRDDDRREANQVNRELRGYLTALYGNPTPEDALFAYMLVQEWDEARRWMPGG